MSYEMLISLVVAIVAALDHKYGWGLLAALLKQSQAEAKPAPKKPATSELPEKDLERVTGGKETIARANRALDTIDRAAGMVEKKGGELLDSGNALFRKP